MSLLDFACILAAVLFAALWLLSRVNLKHAIEALRRYRDGQAGRRLRLSSPDRQMETLIAEINQILDDQQKAEQMHRQAEKQRRDEIANISHDLRTPLTSILGYLQLLEQPSCTPEEHREYLAICESRAHSLQELLSGFYDLSRLEAGGYPLELAAVEPAGLLFQLVADYYMDFVDAGMEPVLKIPQVLPEIYADRTALHRVFQNLIQNALKHGGKQLIIKSFQDQGALCISFQNSAPGLLEEDCGRLFDRFFTADKMRTGKGTGLGLAIVKALCQKMNGSVSAELYEGQLTIQTRFPLSISQVQIH